MAYKFDKNILPFDANKNNELISKSEDMDIQDILQYSLINKFPLAIVIDNFGNNLIHLTINNPKKIKSEFNKLNFIKFLIQNNVNPDQPNKENQTPLHLSCQFQYLSIVQLLLESHVNPNYKDNTGLTPLHYLYTGNIKLFIEKEIKEFIVPNKTKENIIDREALFSLKKILWNLLKTDYNYFFKSLENTIEYTIEHSPEFKTILSKFKNDLALIPNPINNTIIKDKYKNLKTSLYEINEKYWDKFPNNEDIILHDIETESFALDNITGIIKNADGKKEIKNKLKNIIKECSNNINNFKLYEYNDQLMFNNIIKIYNEIFKDKKIISFQNKNHLLVTSGLPQLSPNNYPYNPQELDNIYMLQDKNIINQIINDYANNKHNNAIDLADNIIDYKNFSFVGGSRNITINFDNYDKILERINMFDAINKKVVFILICYYQQYFINDNVLLNQIITEINNLTDNNHDIIFNRLYRITSIVVPLPVIYFNYCRDNIYNIIFYETDINKKQSLYSQYIKFCTQFSDSNLDATINNILIKFFSAFIHDPLLWYESFTNILKYNNFTTCISIYPNHLEGLAVWAGYLLDNKNNFITPFNHNIDIYLTNDNIDINIINIMKNIINNNDLHNNANNIISYYDYLASKFPKMYLLDLVYYVLNPSIILSLKNDPNFNVICIDPIQLIQNILNNNNFHDNIIFNCIYNKLPPSMSSYVYILMDESQDNFLFNKYVESYNLGLLFYGCIPDFLKHIKKNNNLYIIKLNDIIPFIPPGRIIDNYKTITFIFNPNTATIGVASDFNQSPNNFDTDINTPLPFNYFYNITNLNIYDKDKYFKLINNRYRPASTILYNEYLKLLNSKFNKFLHELLHNYNKILKTLLTDKQKISQLFYELFILTKLIIDKQHNITKLDKTIDVDNNFNFKLFIKKLNDINAYIFLYYYLYKPDRVILPEFIYYKLDTDNYKLYKKSNIDFVNSEMVGGSYKELLDQFYVNNIQIQNEDFNFDKSDALPPSIEDNLQLFYQLNKKKIIVDILKNIGNPAVLPLIETNFKPNIIINDNDKYNFMYFNVAKLIEEIIKNYAEYTLKIIIDNKMVSHIPHLDLIDSSLNITVKSFEIPIVLKNTVTSINEIYKHFNDSNKDILYNFYKISEPNIKDNNKGLFIIYPNEYTNTNLLLQKFCITFNNDILNVLLNNGAQPYLPDNNNFICIHNAVKLFNFNSIKFLTNQLNFDEYNFINNELNNHKNKMITNNYVDTFNNFIKTQYEEIKLLILSNDANGNNILFNLHNSFKICFYIMNEYITDYLWKFNDTYSVNEFMSIASILNINKDDINENYLNIVCLNHSELFYNDDITLIKKDFIDILNNDNNELKKQKENLENQINNLKKLRLAYIHIQNKIFTIDNQMAIINEKIESFENINDNNYTDPNIGPKDKIINTYDKLTKKGYGIYNKMWDNLLNNEALLLQSFNLSLIKILMEQNENNSNIILSYLNHVELLACNYFENPKYINNKINKPLTFIYDLLVHLTKTVICFGIEIVTRKVLFAHLINIYKNYSLDDINIIIQRLFNDKYRLEDNTSFIEILYNEYPEIIVKNSINIFSSIDEKINFQPISINEMLQNLFKLLIDSRGIVVLDDIIINNLNKNIANYFDLFTAKIVKNWFVICENTFKFIINHQRISNTLALFPKLHP